EDGARGNPLLLQLGQLPAQGSVAIVSLSAKDLRAILANRDRDIDLPIPNRRPLRRLVLLEEFLFEVRDRFLGLLPLLLQLLDAVGGRLLSARFRERDLVGLAAVAEVVDVAEERDQAVIVLLRDRVDLVVVAAGAI